ncbi:MAG: ATPase, T2SS/T4P/T4SS family [Acidimicrobiales bacterium]
MTGLTALGELERWLQDVVIDHPAAEPSHLVEAVRQAAPLLDTTTVAALVERVRGRARLDGLGALQPLFDDSEVTEIMINGPGPVWADRGGRLEPVDVLLGPHDIGLLVERILEPLGLRVDRTSPWVDARLPDGSRVNVVVPPLALDGPVVTIRRFAAHPVPLASFGPPPLEDLLVRAMAERRTIMVVGATGAGKTTLLNALAATLDPHERVITIEDTAELSFPGRHVVRLEARPASSEGVGAVDLRALLRNALRMRPDRLVIGEVRGAEALDLVLALNTGHRGSLATCHASGPTGALRRLEALAQMGSVDLPRGVVRAQLADALDLIVTVARTADGARRVVAVNAVEDGDEVEAGEPIRTTPLWGQR